MSSRPVAFVLFALLTAGLAAAGCGGGGNGGSTKTGTPPVIETTSPTPADAATPAGTPPTPSADAAAIEALVRAQAAANNNKDVDGFLAAFADRYFTDEIHVTRGDARALVAQFIGEPEVVITRVANIDISGDSATAEVESNEGVILSRERYSLVRENGQWLIAFIEELPVQIDASGAVDLRLVEYAFQLDGQAVQDGSFVFSVTNAGAQQHEVELMRLPDDVNAQQLVDPENKPAGVDTIGLFGPLDPGASATLAFTGALQPGRYALVCYLPDTSGTLHSGLGMVSGFTVG